MKKPYYVYVLLVLVGAAGASGVWWFMNAHNEALRASILSVEQQRSAEITRAQANEQRLNEEKQLLEQTVADLTTNLETLTEDRDELKKELRDVNNQVGDALKTVGVLDKLSKIDPELLQKYSKVYFLNEHYRPAELKQLNDTYLYRETDEEYLHAKVIPFFEEMADDAKDDGVELYVVSAYRSFETQSVLKGSYTVQYGSGANTFSADQGYSEHQLGTTIDFTTVGINGALVVGFESTPAFTWLAENAHRYGFTLSYPKNNAYYMYEPWHWRFVGEDLARDLRKDNQYFYDVDQREIDTYLISLFD